MSNRYDPKTAVAMAQPANRAEEVMNRIVALDKNQIENEFEMGDLFAEAQDGNYVAELGIESLREFIEKAGLEITLRTAENRARVSRITKRLGITQELKLRAKSSKLRKICELDGLKDEETGMPVNLDSKIVELVNVAHTLTVKEINAMVDEIKGKVDKDSVLTWLSLPTFSERKEFIEDTITAVMAMSGDTVNPEGLDPKLAMDISKATAMERMCTYVRNDPNFQMPEEATAMDDFVEHVDEGAETEDDGEFVERDGVKYLVFADGTEIELADE